MSEQLFTKALKESGVPTTESEMKSSFQQIATEQNVVLNNDSDFSPFWRLITSIVITPALWLLQLIITTVLPNAFVQFAKGGFLDLLAAAVDVVRKPATKLQGNITFERAVAGQALIVPAGTRIKTVPINGVQYCVITQKEATFGLDDTQLNVAVEAEHTGSAYNLATGYFSILQQDIAGVTRVFNATGWISKPGAEEEPDDELRLRVRNQFSAVNQYHTDAVYRAIIAENVGIAADRIFFQHNAPRGPGSANAFILFDAAVPGDTFLTKVNKHISEEGNHGHGDDLLVQALPETQHDITATLYVPAYLPEADRTALKTSVEQFIRAVFRERSAGDWTLTQTWPWTRFSFSNLDRELHLTFDNLSSIAWGQSDIVSELNIPRIDSLTLTVEDAQ